MHGNSLEHISKVKNHLKLKCWCFYTVLCPTIINTLFLLRKLGGRANKISCGPNSARRPPVGEPCSIASHHLDSVSLGYSCSLAALGLSPLEGVSGRDRGSGVVEGAASMFTQDSKPTRLGVVEETVHLLTLWEETADTAGLDWRYWSDWGGVGGRSSAADVSEGTIWFGTLAVKLTVRMDEKAFVPKLTAGESFALSGRVVVNALISSLTDGPELTPLQNLLSLHRTHLFLLLSLHPQLIRVLWFPLQSVVDAEFGFCSEVDGGVRHDGLGWFRITVICLHVTIS